MTEHYTTNIADGGGVITHTFSMGEILIAVLLLIIIIILLTNMKSWGDR